MQVSDKDDEGRVSTLHQTATRTKGQIQQHCPQIQEVSGQAQKT